MAPKYHPTPLSGGDRNALAKELGKARAMTNILATQVIQTIATYFTDIAAM
jgi:ribonuclease HII